MVENDAHLDALLMFLDEVVYQRGQREAIDHHEQGPLCRLHEGKERLSGLVEGREADVELHLGNGGGGCGSGHGEASPVRLWMRGVLERVEDQAKDGGETDAQ